MVIIGVLPFCSFWPWADQLRQWGGLVQEDNPLASTRPGYFMVIGVYTAMVSLDRTDEERQRVFPEGLRDSHPPRGSRPPTLLVT